MMQKIFLLIITSTIFIACNKNNGQTKPDVDDQLNRPYCNDPIAINYNDSFPGVPDNSTCIYPEDKFIGSWQVTDSTFKMDSTFLSADSRTITIVSLGESSKDKLKINRWNTCATPLFITANKFGKANIDNLLSSDSGQVLCIDTMVGYFQLTDTNESVMRISINAKSDISNYFHKAIATKL